jgi:lambda repressor-like predicted transcriptional regulator
MEQLQLKNDLQEMLIQYDTLNVKNDRLNAEILGQQEQIKDMLKQMEKHKDDAYIIAKLKKEAATLREIMKGYLVTIDSLNTLNKDLQKDNQFLAEELSQVTSRAQELESTKSNLESIVATGSILQADNLMSVGLKIRNNGSQVEVNKANRTELIRTCANIAENRISPSGKKTIYLRIISPDGKVLEGSNGAEDRFEFNGVSGKFSVKRVIDYNNEKMELCIFYTVEPEAGLATGKYIVEMYEGGMLIGKSDLDLK